MTLKGFLGDWRGCLEPAEAKSQEMCSDVLKNRQPALLKSLASKIYQIAAVGWGGGAGEQKDGAGQVGHGNRGIGCS